MNSIYKLSEMIIVKLTGTWQLINFTPLFISMLQERSD